MDLLHIFLIITIGNSPEILMQSFLIPQKTNQSNTMKWLALFAQFALLQQTQGEPRSMQGVHPEVHLREAEEYTHSAPHKWDMCKQKWELYYGCTPQRTPT